jgi:hypothetical protein
MSIPLLKMLCKWFLLDRETNNGLFAHCFLLMMWNLGCRVNNTTIIKFCDISWANNFDCFQVLFAHSKTNQTGEEALYPRHIFGNPFEPLVCPILSLSMYFTSCFNRFVSADDYLFPGKGQEARFTKALLRVLKENEAEVKGLGYEISSIGLHSIRKGAFSYLSSLPGKIFFCF